MSNSYSTADLTAENTFCDWITPTTQRSFGIYGIGYLELVITGTWVGTLTVQKRHFHGDVTYTDPVDVEEYTFNVAKLIESHSQSVQWRVGFKTGDFSSGTASVRLEK